MNGILNIFKILIFLLELHSGLGLTLKAYLSQDGIHGEVKFFYDPLMDVTIPKKHIFISVNFTYTYPVSDTESWVWFISEFPVDYSLDVKERCSSERIGNRLYDLDEYLGPILFYQSQNFTYFEYDAGNETFSLVGEKGIWGRSLVMYNPNGRRVCGTIFVTDGYEEILAEAKFQFPVSGSVYFRWAGSHKDNVEDSIVFSNLVHANNRSSSQHNWKIYVTDILDSEADKSRANCDFLQIVLNPGDSKTVIGDLTSRLGKVTIGDFKSKHSRSSKSIFQDSGLSSLPVDLIDGGRSLYLVLFDDKHSDSFLSCSKIRYQRNVAVKAIIQSEGITGTVTVSQKTRFDPTWLVFNVTSVNREKVEVAGCQIHELPVDPNLDVSGNRCVPTGQVYNPTGVESNFGSQDAYPIGDLSGKHGDQRYIGSVLTMWDTRLPLFGANSVVHRSLVFYKAISGKQKVPWVCGTLLPYKSNAYNSPAVPMYTLSVTYSYPIVGSIIFRQPKDQPWMETSIIVESLIYSDGWNVNDTFEHRWSINELPPGKDSTSWMKRCLSAGQIYDPYKINFNSDKPEYQCSSDNLGACRLGDLSGKHGLFSVAGSKKNNQKLVRKLLTDENLPLSGRSGILGKSLVIYNDHGPVATGDRMACSKIIPIYRRKAVVKSWHGNGQPATVSGKFEFLQQTKYDITNIDISIKGLVDTQGYHVHLAPVQEQLKFPCEDSTVHGHFNPKKVNPLTVPRRGTPDQYEAGDLSGKFETFENKTTVVTHYNDTYLTLFGQESILGRSIVIHKKKKNQRWVCSTIERGYSPSEARELSAVASFHHPWGFAYGYIRITQLVYNDGAKSDSVIEVNLRHPGKQDRNLTRNHKWAIFVNPVSVDATVKVLSTRCTAGGYVWNPLLIQLANPKNEDLYSSECGPDNPRRCYLGDLSARLGTINLGDKRQVFSDINLPLEGDISAMGRSIVIFTPEGGGDRFACANIEPDKDIIKYVNIRRTPRFDETQFLEEVREIMGVPEWFVTVDSTKTKVLYNGSCIQFLFHFKGAEANKLEQDFSTLMATGRLYSPSLYIPGYNPSDKRKTVISHGPCGTEDPQNENKSKNKSFKKNSASKNKLHLFSLFFLNIFFYSFCFFDLSVYVL